MSEEEQHPLYANVSIFIATFVDLYACFRSKEFSTKDLFKEGESHYLFVSARMGISACVSVINNVTQKGFSMITALQSLSIP